MDIETLYKELLTIQSQEPIIDLVRKDFLDNIGDYLKSLNDEESEEDLYQTIVKNSTLVRGGDPRQALQNQKTLYLELGRQQAISILIKDLIDKPIEISHVKLMGEVKLGFPEFRDKDVFIKKEGNKELNLPSPADIDSALQELLNWLDIESVRERDKLKLIAEFHHRFETIHPFLDGNGRIGRLLIDILLLRFNYLPVLIPKEKRGQYYQSLDAADNGNIEPLKEFLEGLEIETLKSFLQSPNVLSIKEKINLRQKLKEIVGDYDTLVLTEDTNSDTLLKIVFESSGFDLSKVKFLSYDGCTNISSVNLFSIYVKEKFGNLCLIVHRDRDYLTEEEVKKIQEALDRIGAALFITEGTDVESYFLNELHVNHCHPQIARKRASELVNESIRLSREKSIEKIKKKEFGEKYSQKSTHLDKAITQLFDGSPFRFTHGKTTLKRLKGLIQSEVKANAQLFQASQFLKVHELERIRKESCR